jgi:hypothetical protein
MLEAILDVVVIVAATAVNRVHVSNRRGVDTAVTVVWIPLLPWWLAQFFMEWMLFVMADQPCRKIHGRPIMCSPLAVKRLTTRRKSPAAAPQYLVETMLAADIVE